MVDGIFVMKRFSERSMDGTVAKNRYTVRIRGSIIVKTKMGTGTPIAVEMGNVVAFGLGRIEETKAILVFYHVVKLEILDDLFGTKVACHEFGD